MKISDELKKISILLNKKEMIGLFFVFLIYLLNIFFDLVGIGMIIPMINIIIGNELTLLSKFQF